MLGLPIECWVGLACGVVFAVVLVKAMCVAAAEGDQELHELRRACEVRAHQPVTLREAEQITAEDHMTVSELDEIYDAESRS